MKIRPIVVVCTLALAVGAAPAEAVLRVDGHGNGHGIGMPQYGAYGYALKTHHTYRYILSHYYPGTKLRKTAGRQVRVLLKRGSSLLVAEAVRLTAPGRGPISLKPDRTYRFEPDPAGLRVVDTSTGSTATTRRRSRPPPLRFARWSAPSRSRRLLPRR